MYNPKYYCISLVLSYALFFSNVETQVTGVTNITTLLVYLFSWIYCRYWLYWFYALVLQILYGTLKQDIQDVLQGRIGLKAQNSCELL